MVTYLSPFLTKLLVSVVWIAVTLLTNSSYTSFVSTSFFTTSLSLPKSIGAVSNSSISHLSISDFKLTVLAFLPNFDVSRPVTLFKSDFVA